MAAGNSRRFGSNKLLFPWKGKTMYRHGLDLLLELKKGNERAVICNRCNTVS